MVSPSRTVSQQSFRAGGETPAQQRLRRDARQRFLLEMTDELLDESELRKIQLLLLQHIKDRNGDVEVIDYDGFCQARATD